MAGVVVVFDFDKTIIDCDSDNWVVDDLGFTKHFDELLESLPWNTAIDRMMGELHSQGKSIEEIEESLRRAPLSPHTIKAIKSAYALGCELRILSDANIFFIETILKHHGLINYFSEITSNPSYVDDVGRLRIFPYHNFTVSSHGCGLCPPNMCKGAIVEKIKASVCTQEKKKFIYLGDGKGDYCPSLVLGQEDYVMPRKKCPLWELIYNNTKALKAGIHGWSDSEELGRVLLQLVKESILVGCEDAASLLVGDCCKCHDITQLAGHEALPKALPVPN